MDVFGFICDVNKLMFFDSILIYNIAVRIKLYCACGAVVGSDEKIMRDTREVLYVEAAKVRGNAAMVFEKGLFHLERK